MFDHRQYVPVLRWKRSERVALRNLTADVRAAISPLVELVQRDFEPDSKGKQRNVDDVLATKAEELENEWGSSPVFVETSLLSSRLRTSTGHHPLSLLADNARTRKISIIPVTGLGRSQQFQNVVASIASTNGLGVCVRVFRNDVADPGFAKGLLGLVHDLNLSIEEIDLIMDYQLTDSQCQSFGALLTRIPELSRWRTFTFLSGSFPKDLQKIEKNRQETLERLDWLTWSRQVFDGRDSLERIPNFGDYTIQHPFFEEPLPFSNPSASIRYTSESCWVIMRGEGIRNKDGPGYAQYPANAQLLSERLEYTGPNFSYGDRYIYEMGSQTEKPGTPETWLRAGINHHLTFVMRQLAKSFGPSIVV